MALSDADRRSILGANGRVLCNSVWRIRAVDWLSVSEARERIKKCRGYRPFSAVLMTAGHNALRGSGPNQKRAFH
jgi:hypothetical protein